MLAIDCLLHSSSGAGTEPPSTKTSTLSDSMEPHLVSVLIWTSPQQLGQTPQVCPVPVKSQLSSLPGSPAPSPQSWPSSPRFCLQTFIRYTFTSSHRGYLPSQILWAGWKLSRKRNICLCSFQLAPRHTSQVHSFTVALIIAFLCSSGDGAGSFSLRALFALIWRLYFGWILPCDLHSFSLSHKLFVSLLNCMGRQNLYWIGVLMSKPWPFILL